jgi:hypothetical protein
MRLFASFPFFSEAGAMFAALIASLVLVPSALVMLLLDRVRRHRRERDETDRR